MLDWQSLLHVRWECKYPVVIVPKYRKKKLYGKFRKRVGRIITVSPEPRALLCGANLPGD